MAGPSAPDRSPADLSLHPKADSSATGAVCRPCSPVPSYSGCRGEEKGAFEKHLSAAEVHSPNHGQKHGQKRKTGRKGPCLLASWRRGWDSNPRYLAVRLISSQVHSATLPPLRYSSRDSSVNRLREVPLTRLPMVLGLLCSRAAIGRQVLPGQRRLRL